MTIFKWAVAVAVLVTSPALYAANSDGVIVSHYERLQRLSFATDANVASRKIDNAAPVTLSFDALGRSFELQLEPNYGLLSDAARNAMSEDLKVYRGQLAGQPGSWVRIVSLNGMPSGLIWDGTQMFALEAPRNSALAIAEPVIYRLEDTLIVPGAMSCDAAPLSSNGALHYKNLISELSAAKTLKPGAVSEINISAIADFEFTTAFGNNADAAMVARLNNVDGIFSEQLGVQINVTLLETHSNAADPFSGTTDAGALLDELGIYRLNTSAHNRQGLTHLYTGRDLDATTVGIAFGGVLCLARYGVGLSEGNRGITMDSLIAAHEIGHNFGAPHDGQAGSACAAESQTLLMAPSMNGSDQFSACGISEMAEKVAAASCVTSLFDVDMMVSLNGQSPPPLLGNSVTITFDVTNNGTASASDVAVDISLPNNVSFVSAAASAGSCSSGAGTVNCLLGNVPGGSGRTVTISTATTAVGIGVFDVSVSTELDGESSNNQFAAEITVNPAVNLVANGAAAVTVVSGENSIVSAVIENRSILNATAVTLSISLDNGLRADSASWSAGSCTVTDSQIDCEASVLAAQSSSTLNIGIAGIAEGARTYTATLSSNEIDADPSDNSFSGSVTVISANGSSDGETGGGGGTGPLLLFWLMCVLLEKINRRLTPV